MNWYIRHVGTGGYFINVDKGNKIFIRQVKEISPDAWHVLVDDGDVDAYPTYIEMIQRVSTILLDIENGTYKIRS